MTWRYRLGLRLVALMLAIATPLPAPAGPPVTFVIPSLPLADALALFARQSGRQLLFAPRDTAGRRAPAVRGTLEPDQALARLIAGSGLRVRPTASGTYLIERVVVADRRPLPPPSSPQPAAPITDIVVVGTPGGGSARQEAAFAVTRIDRAAIDRVAPAATADILRLVPGLTVETSGGKNGANIFVRGYPSGGDAEYVTWQTEGVPFFPPATLSFLENSQLYRIDETIDRVEAVRGGTSAIVASGQPGATVNLVQREGGASRDGAIRLSAIDDGEVRGDGYVSGPLGPETRALIGGYYSRGDGIRSPGYDADRGGQLTANLRRRVGAGSVLLFARYLNDRSQWLLPIPVEQAGRRITAYPGFDAGRGTFGGPDTRTGTLPGGGRYDLADGRGARIVDLGLNSEIDLGGGVTLRDKASWLTGHADTTGLVPTDGAPIDAADYAAGKGGTIGSLRFADGGGAVSPGQPVIEAGIWRVRKRIDALVDDATIEWKHGPSTATVGLYATRYGSRDHWDLGNDLLLTAEPRARRLDLTLADGRIITRNGFSSGSDFLVDARYHGTDVALYGVDEVRIGQRLRIDGGIRYQHHAVDGRVANTRPAGAGGADGDPLTLYDNDDVVAAAGSTAIRYRNGAWSYTAGANYDVTTRFGGFARISRGHSFPFFDNLRDGIALAPRIDTVEAGLKLSSPRLGIYATLFRNRFEGLATTVITDGAPIASVGGARATGVELEATWRPAAGVSMTISGTWLDARYHRFTTDAGRTDLTGNRIQRQPEWQGRLTPAYATRLAGRPVALSTTIGFVGDRWSDVQNEQLLPRYLKWDVSATIDATDRLRIGLVGDNLTDAIGLTEGNPRMLGAQATGTILARPILGRSVEISARYSFR